MKKSCLRTVRLPLAAAILCLTLPLCAALPSHAQRISDLPSLSRATFASDAALRRMGIVQGDRIIPYSNLENPEDVGVKMHTNYYISRLPAIAAEGLPTVRIMTLMSLSLAAPASLPFALPLRNLQPASPTGTGPGNTFLPADFQKAYGLPSTGGSGVIVLVDAYHYPSALTDFNKFASIAGLPQETSTNATLNSNQVFQVVYAGGRPPIEDSSGGWEGEAALDIEWAHGLAPNAKIILVEANSSGTKDLIYGGVVKANNLPNVREISMSFGSGEYSGQTALDSVFTKSGIVYFASTGDYGAQIEHPSSSPNVVAVGGTSLFTSGDAAQTYVSETGWGVSNGGVKAGGSGGGVSAYEALPSYQQTGVTYNGTTPTKRAVPDVALDADPATGVLVYYNGNYLQVGGTSLSSPAMAAIVNLAGSQSGGMYRASSNAQLTQIYSVFKNAAAYTANFRDTQTGTASSQNSSGTSFSNRCYTGYDLVTGIGTPLGLGGF